MRRVWATFIFAILIFAGINRSVKAATEVNMTGDARVYGVFFTGHNFTCWNNAAWTSFSGTFNHAGRKTEDTFEIWERFRLRSDFVASESVKFRLGFKVEETWGRGTFTAANPSAAIKVYQAYLQFKWPGCNIETTAGLQDITLPQSQLFFGSIVFGGDRIASLTSRVPLMGNTVELLAGFGRMIDSNQTFDPTTTQVGDELDTYFLTLPISLDNFKATPWGLIAIAGRKADYFTLNASGFGIANYAENLISAGSLLNTTIWKNNQTPYWWAGGAFEVTSLEPVRFYADVIYGAGAQADRESSQRHGWFLDAGADYTGWSLMTPQVFGWWSTGEDNSTRNGSERLPQLRPNWGPGNSFLLDCSQELAKNSNMGIKPNGAWGVGISLNNIMFVEKLSHRLTYTYIHGNNSPRAIRALNATLGSNPYFVMGRDLSSNECAHGLNFDTTYIIYENLSAVLESGWAHGYFQQSVWGRRLVHRANSSDVWKVAFGLTYKY